MTTTVLHVARWATMQGLAAVWVHHMLRWRYDHPWR